MGANDIRGLDDLAGAVGAALGLPDIFVRRRTADIVAARRVFNYLAFTGLRCSVTEISRYTGFHYGIAYYNIRRFREGLVYDWRLRDAWRRCAAVAEALGVV